MARLPRYRALGIGVASLPGVNFAQTGQAQARVANTIASSLDRMSSFAFREAEVQAKLEGAEYGAANAPTAQQLEDATTPAEREELVPGGKGTVYDRAARSAAMETISLNLETAARQEITALRMTASASNMATSELQTKIDGVINGYSGALYDINPTSSKRFRAGMSTVGNSAVVAHANKLAELRVKQDKIDAIAGIDSIKTSLSDIIANGDRVVDGVVVSLTDLIAAERSKVFDHAEKIGDPVLLKQQLDDFDKVANDAIVGEVRDWLTTSPNAHRLELQMGKIEDPRIKSIVNNMTSEQMRNAVDASFEVTSRDLALETSLDNKNARKRQAESVGVRGDIIKELAFPGSTGKNLDTLLADLMKIDPEAGLVMQKSILSSASANNPDIIVGLNRIESIGQMTHENLLNALDENLITFDEYTKRYDRLEALKDEDMVLATKILRNAIQKEFSIMPGAAEQARINQIGEIENELIYAKRKDPGIDPVGWMRDRLKDLKPAGATDAEIAKAQGLVNAWADRNNNGNKDLSSVRDALFATQPTEGILAWTSKNQSIIEALKTLEGSQ